MGSVKKHGMGGMGDAETVVNAAFNVGYAAGTEELEDVEAEVGALEGDVASLEEDVASLEGERDALEDLLAEKWRELEGVEERLVVASRSLARRKGTMTGQQRKEAVKFDRTNKMEWSDDIPNHRKQKSRAMRELRGVLTRSCCLPGAVNHNTTASVCKRAQLLSGLLGDLSLEEQKDCLPLETRKKMELDELLVNRVSEVLQYTKLCRNEEQRQE